MSKKMTDKEFHKWVEYNTYEPLNSTDHQLALLTSVVSNMMGGKTTLKDFILLKDSSDREAETKKIDGKNLEKYLEGMF